MFRIALVQVDATGNPTLVVDDVSLDGLSAVDVDQAWRAAQAGARSVRD